MASMDEGRAWSRWCPFARPDVFGDERETRVARGNRTEDGERDGCSDCLGSECMAWRWSETEAEATKRAKKLGVDMDAEYVRRGYCGLSGPVVIHD